MQSAYFKVDSVLSKKKNTHRFNTVVNVPLGPYPTYILDIQHPTIVCIKGWQAFYKKPDGNYCILGFADWVDSVVST